MKVKIKFSLKSFFFFCFLFTIPNYSWLGDKGNWESHSCRLKPFKVNFISIYNTLSIGRYINSEKKYSLERCHQVALTFLIKKIIPKMKLVEIFGLLNFFFGYNLTHQPPLRNNKKTTNFKNLLRSKRKYGGK